MRKFFIAAIVVLVSVFFLFSGAGKFKKTETPSVISPSSSSASVSSAIALSFDFGNNQKISLKKDFKAGDTLFDIILKTNLKIKTKEFPPFGFIIENINGFQNGAGGRYWQFWINGKYAQVGASSYKPQPGDSIDWKFTP